MASVKTAISIEESLFEKADKLARKMNISRSKFFAKAAAEYIRRHDKQAMLKKLNEVYVEPPDQEEREFLDAAAASFAKLTEGQW